MGLVSFLRDVFWFIIGASILDTIITTALIGSGVKIYDWAYFAPSYDAMNFYNAIVSMRGSFSSSNVSASVIAYFFLIIIPAFIFVFSNFIVGLFWGLPLMTSRLLTAAGAPLPVIVAFTGVGILLQVFADLWVIDTIIAYIFGRSTFLSMLFGE